MSTLADIAKANGVENILNEAARPHPELTDIASFPMQGLIVRSVVYTGASNTTGSFRSANRGTADITETSEVRNFQCYGAEPRIEEDRMVAADYEDGPLAWMDAKAIRILDLEMLAWCRQMYYGSGNNPEGFPGLIHMYDSANMVVDAGGSTANTGSSVWLVRAAPADNKTHDGVRWRFGNNGSMKFDPVTTQVFLDPEDPNKKLVKYHTSFMAKVGFQVQTLTSVCRIKKLTEDESKGLTDSLIARALAKFPEGKGPNLIFLTQRSLLQLQQSRTATNPLGTPAPWPTSVLGIDGQPIPLRVTAAISNTEPLTL